MRRGHSLTKNLIFVVLQFERLHCDGEVVWNKCSKLASAAGGWQVSKLAGDMERRGFVPARVGPRS